MKFYKNKYFWFIILFFTLISILILLTIFIENEKTINFIESSCSIFFIVLSLFLAFIALKESKKSSKFLEEIEEHQKEIKYLQRILLDKKVSEERKEIKLNPYKKVENDRSIVKEKIKNLDDYFRNKN